MGLVIGDALGVPVEFTSRIERDADPVTDMRAYGTHLQPAGTWSDDSSKHGLKIPASDGAYSDFIEKIKISETAFKSIF